ncbi:MAG TPA: VOC family protein [Chitinophagaceae bacterium]
MRKEMQLKQGKRNEAISFVVNCDTQADIDYYWEKFSASDYEKAQVCKWLKDIKE